MFHTISHNQLEEMAPAQLLREASETRQLDQAVTIPETINDDHKTLVAPAPFRYLTLENVLLKLSDNYHSTIRDRSFFEQLLSNNQSIHDILFETMCLQVIALFSARERNSISSDRKNSIFIAIFDGIQDQYLEQCLKQDPNKLAKIDHFNTLFNKIKKLCQEAPRTIIGTTISINRQHRTTYPIRSSALLDILKLIISTRSIEEIKTESIALLSAYKIRFDNAIQKTPVLPSPENKKKAPIPIKRKADEAPHQESTKTPKLLPAALAPKTNAIQETQVLPSSENKKIASKKISPTPVKRKTDEALLQKGTKTPKPLPAVLAPPQANELFPSKSPSLLMVFAKDTKLDVLASICATQPFATLPRLSSEQLDNPLHATAQHPLLSAYPLSRATVTTAMLEDETSQSTPIFRL